MKILLSAYACAPDNGSECAAGARAVEAAASRHDVWVLTQPEMGRALGRALRQTPLGARVTIVPVPPDVQGSSGGLRRLVAEHRRHDEWQRNASRVALELDRIVDFDVVHHVTLAAYWLRVGVAALDKPLVWGPVGGAVEPPLRLASSLGIKGITEAAVRGVARRAIATMLRAGQAHAAATVFVQNPETAARLDPRLQVSLLPNPLVAQASSIPALSRGTDIAFVGRLIPWKGVALALDALRHVTHPDAVLRIYGQGRDRARLERIARRYGVADRVAFEGFLPHDQLLARIATAGVLLHPALHEEGGFAVAEALTVGTPVVTLDHGGPAQLVRMWPQAPAEAVRVGSRTATVRALAAAVDRFLGERPAVPRRPLTPVQSFSDRVLAAYEQAAAGRERGRLDDAPASTRSGAGAA